MESIDIFTLALGLQEPWSVTKAAFVEAKEGERELHLTIGFKKGHRFQVPGSEPRTAYDTVERTWRHLNFFQHRCYIHASVPRIRIDEHHISMVEVPWARPQSGFTLLFEAYQMLLIEGEMPVSKVSETVKETSPRIWRVFGYWVERALRKEDLSSVTRVGVDETSRKKGHQYVTQFVDMDAHRTIYVTQGKDSLTVENFAEYLESHGGRVENIKMVSMDMSAAFEAGFRKIFPNAEITFDKFHLCQSANKAVDSVRKDERKDSETLKNTRFTLLYGNENLSVGRSIELDNIIESHPKIGLAYELKEAFRDLYSISDAESAAGYLAFWCDRADDSKLVPFQNFSKTIKKHWNGVLSYFKPGNLNNGLLEGINTKIQLAKRRARGFSNIDNFILMIYFISGKLKLDDPHNSL